MVDSQPFKDTVTHNMRVILQALRDAVAALPHKHGIDRWHSDFFEKALAKWETEELKYDSDVFCMVSSTFPADLVEMIGWDTLWEGDYRTAL
jgi:hypothetical protein